MARTELTLQTTTRSGVEATFAAVDDTNGESFDNVGENVLLHVKNGSGGAVVVTITTPGSVDGVALADRTISVPAGEERIIGPFPNNLYGQADVDNDIDKAVFIDYDTGTTITVAAIEVGGKSY